jgi:hypothetical protein
LPVDFLFQAFRARIKLKLHLKHLKDNIGPVRKGYSQVV